MHKREFLKRLVGMGGATAFASSLPAHDWTSPEFPSADRPIIHRNWSIYWTGWKATAHTDRLHGQWLARKVDDDTSPRLYVGVHYPIDVLVGITIGIVIPFVLHKVFLQVAKRVILNVLNKIKVTEFSYL